MCWREISTLGLIKFDFSNLIPLALTGPDKYLTWRSHRFANEKKSLLETKIKDHRFAEGRDGQAFLSQGVPHLRRSRIQDLSFDKTPVLQHLQFLGKNT